MSIISSATLSRTSFVYIRERALRRGREVEFAALLGSAAVAVLTHKATQFLCEWRKIFAIGFDIEIKAI